MSDVPECSAAELHSLILPDFHSVGCAEQLVTVTNALAFDGGEPSRNMKNAASATQI